MHERVETVVRVDGRRVHRFQVVRERRDGDRGGEGSGGGGRRCEGSGGGEEAGRVAEEWIVVGFEDDEVELADLEFDRSRSVPKKAFRSGQFEPLSAGGVPVWGY